MALSPDGKALLDLLNPQGRPANLKRLKDQLGRDDQTLEHAQTELIEAGLAKPVGRGRLARTAGNIVGLAPEAQMLFSQLPADGSTVGNYSLRSLLQLDDETYTHAKRELRERGLINVGVGYGGTVARSIADAKAGEANRNRVPGAVVAEKDLYEPFAEWLRSSLQDQELAFSQVKVTATARGRNRAGGKWSRPDVTAVQVFRYEWLPDVSVEVSSYEIKRAGDAEKLESVYEAAAHQRWVHRASLVVEQLEDRPPVPPTSQDEIARFRLGLYSLKRREDGKFDVKELIKPPLHTDFQPEDLNDLLRFFLASDVTRQEYRTAIGR